MARRVRGDARRRGCLVGKGGGETVVGGQLRNHILFAVEQTIIFATNRQWRDPVRVLLLAACRLLRQRTNAKSGDTFMTKAWAARADVLRWEQKDQA